MAMMTEEEKRDILSSLTLWDDRFFSSCFDGDIESASLVLGIILDRDDLKVEGVRTQEWMQNLAGHSARMDIVARAADGTAVDIEIQNAKRGASRRRARFYSSMMDVKSLRKREDYRKLPESYVIFITPKDAIGRGMALYEIERTIKGTAEPFADGSHIVYVSAELADRSTRLGKLMHDMGCRDPKEMYYTTLRKRVSYFKETEEGISDMSDKFDAVLQRVKKETEERGRKKWRAEGKEEGRTEGIAIGEKNNALHSARTMLADGVLPLSKVAEYSGLPLNEVESLRNSMHV